MPAIARQTFLDPKILARIGDLELLARTVVDGFMSGLHRSPNLGATTDFAEHRGYMPGDDVRRVDWRLYARTDRLHVKEFEADTNASVTVLLDVSRSMRFAAGERIPKLDYARYLAASLLWLSHRQRDRVGLLTFDDAVRDYVAPSAKHLPMVLHAIDRARAERAGELEGPLRQASEHFRRRGILVVISDFYAEPAAALRAVLQLRNRGNELLVMQVLDRAELEFPFDERGSFEDLETGERIPVVPAEVRARYRELMDAHLAELRRLFAASGVDYALLDTATPLDHALSSYLTSRQRLVRVR
jgi:uncharacterized protein (DUF58 family)